MPTATKSKPNRLRPTQRKVLASLVKSNADNEASAIKMSEIVKKVKVSKVMAHFACGSVNPKNRDKHDKKRSEKDGDGYKSLLSRGFIKVVRFPDEWFVRYYVTPLGKRAYEATVD